MIVFADLFLVAVFYHLFFAFLAGKFGCPSQPARIPIVDVHAWSWGAEYQSCAVHLDVTCWSLEMDGLGVVENGGKTA